MSAVEDTTAARQHDLLKCEHIGDTIVVTPLGDRMEHSNGTFENELGRIRRIASTELVRNIICDFSQKDYFSQELVVPLLGLRDQIRTKGRLVTAGMSEQMAKLFEHSESGTHLLHYPDRNTAVSAVADVSVSEAVSARFRQHRAVLGPLVTVVVLAALAAGWFFVVSPIVNGSPARQLYTAIEDIWDDAETVAQSDPKKSNWNGLGNRMHERVIGSVKSLREKPDSTPAEKAVLATAVELLTISANPRDMIEVKQVAFLKLAEQARVAIEQEDGIQLAALEPINVPKSN